MKRPNLISILLVLLIAAPALAESNQCQLIFANSHKQLTPVNEIDVPQPLIKFDVRRVKADEILNSISEAEWQNKAALHNTLEKLARSMSVSKDQFDDWMKMFVDTGMVGGTIHMHSLFGSRWETSIAQMGVYDRNLGDFTKWTVKRAFAPYLRGSVDSKLLNDRAVKMSEVAIGFETGTSPFEYKVENQYRRAHYNRDKNNIKEAPLHEEVIKLAGKQQKINATRMQVLLAAIYRSTLKDAMRGAIKATPSKFTELFVGDKVTKIVGVTGIAGGILSAGVGFFGMGTGLIHDPMLFFEIFAGGLVGGKTHLAIGNAYMGSKSQRFLKKFSKKPVEIPKLEVEPTTLVVQELNEFNPTEAFSSFTIPLRAQLDKEALFGELTSLSTAKEMRIAVDQSLTTSKLAIDTLDVQLRRTKQISEKIDQLLMYLSGRGKLNDIAEAKLENVMSNLRHYIELLTEDSEYTLQVCDALESMLGKIHDSDLVQDSKSAQLRDDANYIKEFVINRKLTYVTQLEDSFNQANKKLSELQRAYLVQSPNFFDEALKDVRKK